MSLLKELLEAQGARRDTATGWYIISGDTVIADNSGYQDKFSRTELMQGLQTGILRDWEISTNPPYYGLSGPEYFVVENSDIMHEFLISDFT